MQPPPVQLPENPPGAAAAVGPRTPLIGSALFPEKTEQQGDT